MRSHARAFGHPIHRMLVPIPVGLFVVGASLDIAHRFIGASWMPTVSFWNLTIGSCAALVAAFFGAVDLFGIPDGTRAKTIGGVHAIGSVCVLAAFTIARIIRSQNRFAPGPSIAFALEVGALLLASVTAWLGGEFVDRLGVGVDDGAHFKAPSSLDVDAPAAPPRVSYP